MWINLVWLFILVVVLWYVGFPNVVCIWKTVYRTVRMLLRTGWYVRIEGCNFELMDDPIPKNIQIIRCQCCGKLVVGWCWTEFDRSTGALKSDSDVEVGGV